MATMMAERQSEQTPDTQTDTRAEALEGAARSMSITITKNGPYVVSGGVPLLQEIITPVDGHREYRLRRSFPPAQTYALCRCGRTKTPPFCDGSHMTVGFEGAETASKAPYEERADIYPGAGVFLMDDNRCAYARFCHREDGDVWTLTERSGDARLKDEAIKASSDCPAGRLVHFDAAEGGSYEPQLEPSISLLEDPEVGASGPLFVRGGIPLIGADGSVYELRNRYALCRCGSSRNKPFCDAMHVTVSFSDGLF
ncbi:MULTISPECIES: CDGSH iron-sulfur domain-containing protein [Gordonibacter]|uniref:CDGSH iron-sulfur domain-containing protein n=1 Tax=Gordonibacter faecis TaxID=3047475 RepID=A0ABT7DNN5_9ACTN|nr:MULTISPECIES: CDGSH iron-sulfur domain-containing protein [unclassified Gordonibacter]MDJ1650837.1 CDGSH iron-sulfur domain-containing protein [Gordonibacter sp. KGMB12511]